MWSEKLSERRGDAVGSWERDKKGMPLKVAIMSFALGQSRFVPGVVNGRRWSREADMVSQLTSCRGYLLAMSWPAVSKLFPFSHHFSISKEKIIKACIKDFLVINFTGDGRFWLLEWIIQTDCNAKVLLYCISSFPLSLAVSSHTSNTHRFSLSHTFLLLLLHCLLPIQFMSLLWL